jgi:hypothetical protein
LATEDMNKLCSLSILASSLLTHQAADRLVCGKSITFKGQL